MIWDIDSYIVHEVGPIAVQHSPTTKLAPIDPDYRKRVRATYAAMLEKQRARRKKANGTQG